MRTIRLGRTGLEVSRIGFGGIPIQRLTEAEAIRVVQRCLDLGVTFFDTANVYTTSEECIGKALSARPGWRQRVVIATKTAARDRATAEEHLELSLKRLAVETIDIWQFHNLSTPEVYEQVLAPGGAMEAAQRALEVGKIRHIGFSSHSLDMALKLVPSGHFGTIQFPFNLVTNEPADRLVSLAQEHGVGFVAMKPLGGGMLSDASLAIRYLLKFDTVLPDPGIEHVREIEEIADIVAGSWELTPADWQEIALIRAEVGVRFCRRCGYCQPCPEGVQISTVINLPSILKRIPIDRIMTGNLAQALQTGQDCIQCGECEEQCPYRLPIREMIVECMDLYERTLAAES